MNHKEFTEKLLDVDFSPFMLPVVIDDDHKYYSKLTEILEQYEKMVFELDFIEERIKLNIRENIDSIKDAMISYYSGNLEESKNEIRKILNTYLDSSLVTTISNSSAFYGILMQHTDVEPTFFRARTGKNEFEVQDMLPISMDNRGIVSTNRFSIPGIPCLYLGTTSYCCWLEMDMPLDNEFYVSAIKMNKNLKILNFAIGFSNLEGEQILAQVEHSLTQGLINSFYDRTLDLIQLWPLICATSFVNKNATNNFRSEYVISQFITQIIQEKDEIIGVAYSSKKLKESRAFPHAINLAIPMVPNLKQNHSQNKYLGYMHDEKYSEKLKEIKFSLPQNLNVYSKFENSLNIHIKKDFSVKDTGERTLVNTFFAPMYALQDEPIEYSRTLFGRFDNYLNSSMENIYWENGEIIKK